MKATPSLSEQQTLESSGRPATDDLTIADHLRQRYQKFSGEGVSVFADGDNPPLKIPERKAQQFIKTFGPLHPGDYEAEHKRDWRDDFRALANRQRP